MSTDEFGIPNTWYKYKFPLPVVPDAPVPSKANYDPHNVAWLIEFFGSVIGEPYLNLVLRYENNTPLNKKDDIFVAHPGDKQYWPSHNTCTMHKSKAQAEYERAAKKSARLKLFQDHSPARIEYFKPSCKSH